MSAYIKEHLGSKLPIRRVISWSAPLSGSFLLWWAKERLRGWHEIITDKGVTREFCPSNPITIDLRERMERTDAVSPTYFTISGFCDFLVRPSSAMPHFVRAEHTKMLPHVGHFNIKVSLSAWKCVIEYLDEFMSTV